ncbi:hypothetical protein GCM10023210_20550 [Chryseobacterium ginsengisoli]|uniref:Uncharacterized protein n=1 Tax=Chryseobacterium ginsengisoli TaxID=363853 RepID=A0ABP9M7S3_9FLAO
MGSLKIPMKQQSAQKVRNGFIFKFLKSCFKIVFVIKTAFRHEQKREEIYNRNNDRNESPAK